ncbi:choice-of-anchor Q domain-containing protein [Dokdonella sp.]|uniref:choice-of-anchor Q domain-containing protein n=1 Tax=Dokdonella sp. TaxID=2291710 RepID=UPI00262130F9|nr:choice-of-anchor Q domain-containing protein [Dokdonella sp.]
MRPPPRPAPLRCRHLAVALAAALASGAAAGASAQSAWQRLRTEPGWPLFGELAGAAHHRAAPDTPGAARRVANCDDDGPGSLRATIADAADGDTIDLTQLGCSRITLETGAIAIRTDNLTVAGKGAGRSIVDGGDRNRVFIHYGFGTLTLQDLTVSGGYVRASGNRVAFGGCIAARSYISLDRAIVRDCRAIGVGSYGGGTFSYGLLMQDSTITGNLASGQLDDATTAAFGGGAYAYSVQIVDSTVTGNRAIYQADPRFSSYGIGGGVMAILGGSISRSTIDSNVSQGRGGGIAAFSALTVSNSTISGNLAQKEIGGGLFVRWPASLQLDNSTVALNRAGADGGGIWLNATGSSFRSSIVHGNVVAGNVGNDTGHDIGNRLNPYSPGAAQTIQGDHNLIGTGGTLIALPPDTLHVDPMLDSLASNGGPTHTHALRSGSPAIDAGDNPDGLATDQRGKIRRYGTAVDIGAYEDQPAAPAAPPQPVPGLSTWAALLLAAAIGGAATTGASRRILRHRPPRR